ncbi:MAG TPA: chemotaxis protein CheW [Pyrinomonadaceae bacterium]|nr:chemotaxis protein CheW [Pyrinomonadaceae bacterium]
MAVEISRPDDQPGKSDEPQLRDLFLFTAGSRSFGVSAEEVDGTAEAKQPAPLPHAPPSILGVIHARGRMLTLFDPLKLLTGGAPPDGSSFETIICLRGDEQLALAAESIGETITISSSDVEPNESAAESAGAIAGILRHGGEEITILEPANLFAAAIYRRDRRRRRF